MSIYLCHKCEGVLQGETPNGAYNCNCISGWVRGFYSPVAPSEVLTRQYHHLTESLALYKSQGRAETDTLMHNTRNALAAIQKLL